jgi:hypothetical protein
MEGENMTIALRSFLFIGLGLLLLNACARRQSAGIVGMPPELYSSRHAFGSREGALEAYRNPTPQVVKKASPAAANMMDDMTYEEQKEMVDSYRNLGPELQADARKDPSKAIRYYNRNMATPLTLGDLPPAEQQEMLQRYQDLSPEAREELLKQSDEHIK